MIAPVGDGSNHSEEVEMKFFIAGIFAAMIFAGCGGWGGYIHKSDRFGFKFTFPVGWEVFNRSDDARDRLIGTIPEYEKSEIEIVADKVAPDISPSEIYPSFNAWEVDAEEFRVEDRGTMACKNAEGRYFTYSYRTEEGYMQGMRVIFLGNRFILRIYIEMFQDEYLLNEIEFRRMIRFIEL